MTKMQTRLAAVTIPAAGVEPIMRGWLLLLGREAKSHPSSTLGEPRGWASGSQEPLSLLDWAAWLAVSHGWEAAADRVIEELGKMPSSSYLLKRGHQIPRWIAENWAPVPDPLRRIGDAVTAAMKAAEEEEAARVEEPSPEPCPWCGFYHPEPHG